MAETATEARVAWEAQTIADADADIAAGRLIDEADVDAWIDSIGTDHELPVPHADTRTMAAVGLQARFIAEALICVGISLWTMVGHTPEAQAHVTSICWIEQVRQKARGVDIYFMQTKTRVVRNGTWEDMPLALITIEGKKTAYPHVYATVGDKLFLANSPEDGCSMEVAVQAGIIGVMANAHFNPPGLPGATSTQFIPAALIKP